MRTNVSYLKRNSKDEKNSSLTQTSHDYKDKVHTEAKTRTEEQPSSHEDLLHQRCRTRTRDRRQDKAEDQKRSTASPKSRQIHQELEPQVLTHPTHIWTFRPGWIESPPPWPQPCVKRTNWINEVVMTSRSGEQTWSRRGGEQRPSISSLNLKKCSCTRGSEVDSEKQQDCLQNQFILCRLGEQNQVKWRNDVSAALVPPTGLIKDVKETGPGL